MMSIYERALRECNYNAARFVQMLYDHRGLATAKILLRAPTVSDGYRALWDRNGLDLTVEALILAEEWNPLFSEEERTIARTRLTDYGYNVGPAAVGPRQS